MSQPISVQDTPPVLILLSFFVYNLYEYVWSCRDFFVNLGIVELDSIGYERGHGNESFW